MAKTPYSKKPVSTLSSAQTNVLNKLKQQAGDFSCVQQLLHATSLSQLIGLEYESNLILNQFTLSLFKTIKKHLPGVELKKISTDSIMSEKALDELCVNICTKTFFASDTIYLISDAKKLKEPALKKLVNACLRSENSLTILTLDSFPNLKFWGTLLEEPCRYSLKNPSGEKLISWIKDQGQELSLSDVSDEAATFLIEEHEQNPEKIFQTLEKASLLLPLNSPLGLKELMGILKKGMHRDVFDLFNAIAKKDALLSSLILDRVFAEGTHPLQIVAIISKNLRCLAGNLSKVSSPSSEISNPWILKKLPSKLFSTERIQNGLRILSELDSGLKGRNFGEEEYLRSKLLSI